VRYIIRSHPLISLGFHAGAPIGSFLVVFLQTDHKTIATSTIGSLFFTGGPLGVPGPVVGTPVCPVLARRHARAIRVVASSATAAGVKRGETAQCRN
jgi:hypothetical protein